MNKQEYFDYNMAPIGSIIQNNEKHYQVIGHGIGIAKDKKEDELPLSEIDKKILQYINECGDQLLSQIHEEHAFTEDAPHLCDNTCTTLDIDISNYIDEVLRKIDVFSEDYRHKWDKDYLLGFYRPFHFYEEWGIFIKATGQARQALSLKRNSTTDRNKYGDPSIDSCYLISKIFTFFHEFYHHKIESLAYKFEIITRQPHYTSGFHCLYCNTFMTNRCLEEAFAHTFAYFETYENLYPYLSRMGLDGKQLRYILKDLIIKNSPPGYNLAEKIIAANNKEEAKNFEYYFFEAVLRYSYKLNTGVDLPAIDEEKYWKNFKHATHPILFTENDVTFIIDIDDISRIQVRNIFIP